MEEPSGPTLNTDHDSDSSPGYPFPPDDAPDRRDDGPSPFDHVITDPVDAPDALSEVDPERLLEELDQFLELCRTIGDTPSSLLDDTIFDEDMQVPVDIEPEELNDLRKSLRLLSFFSAVGDDDPGLSDLSPDPPDPSMFAPIQSDGPLFVNKRYVLRHPIGRGSYGIVFRAFDLVAQREVALKMPRPELRGIRSVMQRFYREGTSIGKITHPGLVPLLDMGQDNGTPYLVTRLVNGPNLEQWLEQTNGHIPIEIAARWGEQLAESVDHLHKKSIVHGDIKPSNILLEHPYEEDILELQPDMLSVCVTDFGNASVIRSSSPGSSERLVGTLCFMAPEQLAPEFRTDVRSDVYAICAVIYELITGRPVFESSESRSLETAIRHVQPAPVRRLRPNAPYALQAIVMKGLSKNPDDRYASAGDLARDLNAWRNMRTPEVLQHEKLRRVALWLRRNRLILSVLTASLLTIGAIALVRNYENRIQARIALDRERMAWWSHYVDQIDAANRFIEMNSPRQANAILSGLGQWPAELGRRDDPREFAWHYLNDQGRDRFRVLPGIPRASVQLCLAADAARDRIFSGGSDGVLRIIDIRDEAVTMSRKIQDQPIQSIAVAPDGKSIAASDPSGTVRLLDTTSLEPIETLQPHTDEVTSLAFTPDGNRLLSTSLDGFFSILDRLNSGQRKISSGQPFQTDPRHATHGVAILPDGVTAAVAQANKRIRIHDLRTGELQRGLLGHFGEVQQAVVSADGRWLVSTGDDLTIAFWDLTSQGLTNQVAAGTRFGYVKPPVGGETKTRKVRSLTTINDLDGQNLVAVDTDEGHIKLFEIPTGTEMGHLVGDYGHIYAMLWLPQSRKLVAAGNDAVRFWDAPFIEQSIHSDSFEFARDNTGEETVCFFDVDHKGATQWRDERPILCLKYDHTDFRIDRTAAAANGRLWGAISKRFDQEHGTMRVEFRFAQARLSVSSPESEIDWKLADSHLVQRRRTAPSIKGHPTRPYFIVLDSDGRVTHIDLTDPARPEVRALERGVDFATFRPDSDDLLIIHDQFRKVSLWNARTDQLAPTPIESLPPDPQLVMAQFAGSADSVVTARVGGFLELRDLSTGKIRKTIYLPEIGDRRVRELVFTEGMESMFVVMGFEDIILVDLVTGKIMLQWMFRNRQILKIDLSADGRSLWILESPPDVDRGQGIYQQRRRIRRLHAPDFVGRSIRHEAIERQSSDPITGFARIQK